MYILKVLLSIDYWQLQKTSISYKENNNLNSRHFKEAGQIELIFELGTFKSKKKIYLHIYKYMNLPKNYVILF